VFASGRSLAPTALSTTGIPEHPRWRHLSAAVAFLVLALLLARLPQVQTLFGPTPPS
jgi:hypothetical protein